MDRIRSRTSCVAPQESSSSRARRICHVDGGIARGVLVFYWICVLIAFVPGTNGFVCARGGGDQTTKNTSQPDQAQLALAGEVELAHLIDLCAERLDLNIEYDATLIKGTVILRLEGTLADDELWQLTNRVLASRQLTSIRIPGAESNRSLSIVKIADAPSLAGVQVAIAQDGIEPPDESLAGPGYTTVVTRIVNQPVEPLLESIRAMLSRQGSQAVTVGDDGLIMISDLTARIEQVLIILELIDVPQVEAQVESYHPAHFPAAQLAATVTTVLNSKAAVEERTFTGKVLADPAGGGHLLLIGSSDNIAAIRALLGQFDREPRVETRTYTASAFDARDVATLIERVVRPQDSALWSMVENEFTGSLIITATPKDHARVRDLIDELNTLPIEARRPMRAFKIRNRDVDEITDLVRQLLSDGAFDGTTDDTIGPDGIHADASAAPTGDVNASSSNTDGSRSNALLHSDSSNDADQSARPTSARNPARLSRDTADPRPTVMFTADKGTNTLIAIGEPRLLSQIESLIASLDVRQPQVMLEVLIISLTDGQTRDLGVELEKLEVSGDTLITLSSLFGLSMSSDDDDGASRSVSDPRGGSIVVLNPGNFSVIVRALETLNEGRTLNIPKVLVSNNQQATLDSVLRQPFASVNASDTVATTSFGGTEDAGTQVTVTPHIAEGDHLVLEYAISLSSFVGESSDPSLPPPRQENSLQSVATVPDGFTIALGGLEAVTDGRAVSQVPWLSQLPVLGELVKSRSASRSRSRFFVFLRPQIMRHEQFRSLKFLSRQILSSHRLDDGCPEVEPIVIY